MKNKAKFVVLMGPGGSGKNTQGKRIEEIKFDVGGIHTDMSDLIDAEGKKNHNFKKMAEALRRKGDLLPCHLITDLFKKMVEEKPKSSTHILTGYPRTLIQGISFNQFLIEKYGVESYNHRMVAIELCLSEEQALERARKRCDEAIAHGKKPRLDDDPEIVVRRFETYQFETYPLLHYFKEIGISVRRIDATMPVDAVTNCILVAIEEAFSK